MWLTLRRDKSLRLLLLNVVYLCKESSLYPSWFNILFYCFQYYTAHCILTKKTNANYTQLSNASKMRNNNTVVTGMVLFHENSTFFPGCHMSACVNLYLIACSFVPKCAIILQNLTILSIVERITLNAYVVLLVWISEYVLKQGDNFINVQMRVR